MPVTAFGKRIGKLADGYLAVGADNEVYAHVQKALGKHGGVGSAADGGNVGVGAYGGYNLVHGLKIHGAHDGKAHHVRLFFFHYVAQQFQFRLAGRLGVDAVKVFVEHGNHPIACVSQRSFQITDAQRFYVVECHQKNGLSLACAAQ